MAENAKKLSMNMKKYFNIEIPKRHSQCSHAQEELIPGKDVYSAVYEDGNSLAREDYCSHCWTQLQKDAKLGEAITHWKSVVPEKKEVKEIYLDRDEKALALLKECLGVDNPEKLQEAMILALYLARRRKLYNRKEVADEDGEVAIIFEVAETQELIAVKKIDLATVDITKIQKIIAANLKD